MLKFVRRVSPNKFNTLSPTPDFPNQGCYFFIVPELCQPELEEGAFYFFTYGHAKDTGKTDKRGKTIYNRTATPRRKMADPIPRGDMTEEEYRTAVHEKELELSQFIRDIATLVRKERI